MVLFLLLVIAAIALGIVGSVVHGLFYLLVIGVVVFLVAFVLLGTRMRRRRPVRLPVLTAGRYGESGRQRYPAGYLAD